jgi:hypothetical protein
MRESAMLQLLLWAAGMAFGACAVCYVLRRLERLSQGVRRIPPALERSGQRIVPAGVTHNWTNATGDGLASTAANWTNGQVQDGDSLVFDGVSGPRSNTPATIDPNLISGGGGNPLKVADITVANTYTSTISITTDFEARGTLSDASPQASVTVASGKTFIVHACSLIGGTLNGPGSLWVQFSPNTSGSMDVSANASLVGLQLKTDSNVAFNVLGTVTFTQGSAASTYGTTNWNAGDVNVLNNSSISNYGTWNVNCNNTLHGVAGAFYNGGTFLKATTDRTTDLAIRFDNAPLPGAQQPPSVIASNGTIEFDRNGNQAGLFYANGGGILEFAMGTQTFTGPSQFYGSGRVQLIGGATFFTQLGVPVTDWSGQFELGGIATLDGTGLYTFNGLLLWDGGTIQNTSVTTNAQTNITGANGVDLINAHLTTNQLTVWDATADIQLTGSTIQNFAEFRVSNAQTMDDLAPANPSMFSNADDGQGHRGWVNKIAGGASTFKVIFHNSGMLLFNGRAINFTAAFDQSGVGSLTRLDGGTMTTSSTFNMTAGMLVAPGTINGDIQMGGALQFSGATGALTVLGNFTETANSSVQLRVGGNQANQYDQVHVLGTATLNGLLHLALINGFTPAPTDRFVVLTSGMALAGTWIVDPGWTAYPHAFDFTLSMP